MRITERRLRKVIRQVIKEAQINEMMSDMYYDDSMLGSKGHSESFISLTSPITDLESASDKEIHNLISEFLSLGLKGSVRTAYISALITPVAALAAMMGASLGGAVGISIGTLLLTLVTTGALNEILRKRLGLDELDVNIEGGFKSMVGRRKFLHKDYKGLERFVNERMPEIIDA